MILIRPTLVLTTSLDEHSEGQTEKLSTNHRLRKSKSKKVHGSILEKQGSKEE